MKIIENENKIILKDVKNFDIEKTFECGQCFRFDKMGDSYIGIVGEKRLILTQKQNDVEINITKKEFDEKFYHYFDFERDYKAIESAFEKDKVLKNTIKTSSGIRILKQDPFETMISFIISASNNIPRIKKIIGLLCQNFGVRHVDEMGEYFSFPSAKTLAELKIEDLSVIKAGYRDKYILDCAKKVDLGEIDILSLFNIGYDDARKELLKINGVGPKVADCILLFAFGYIESFPKDTWIKKALFELYNQKSDDNIDFYGYGGIAQQYLFYYMRQKK